MTHQPMQQQVPYPSGLGSLFATYAREPQLQLQVVCPSCQSDDVKAGRANGRPPGNGDNRGWRSNLSLL